MQNDIEQIHKEIVEVSGNSLMNEDVTIKFFKDNVAPIMERLKEVSSLIDEFQNSDDFKYEDGIHHYAEEFSKLLKEHKKLLKLLKERYKRMKRVQAIANKKSRTS